MKLLNGFYRVILPLLVVCVIGPFSGHGAQPAEELLNEINQLPQGERQARLEKGARKEGEVVWYAAMNRAKLQELINAFEAEYPYVKVQVITGGGRRFVSRIITEARSKKYLFDMSNTGSLFLDSLRRAEAIMRYRTPQRQFLRQGFYDEEGYLNGVFSTPYVLAYNTELVAKDEVPRSIEDLTLPRWKGKLGIDENAYEWLMPLLDFYGEEKGQKIARRIGEQQLNVRRGHTLMTQLVAAGEFQIQIDGYHHSVRTAKESGAPIDYIFTQPFVPVKTPTALYFSSHPPHPHATALLVDFLLSKKGQKIMVGHGRWVSRKDAEDPDNVGGRNPIIPSYAKWGERVNDVIKISDKLLLRK